MKQMNVPMLNDVEVTEKKCSKHRNTVLLVIRKDCLYASVKMGLFSAKGLKHVVLLEIKTLEWKFIC